MRLINERTGAVVEAPISFGGGDWVSYEESKKGKHLKSKTVEDSSPAPAEQLVNILADRTDESPDTSDLSKAEIMRELDAFGVAYNPRAKKADLYKLMQEQLNNG